MPRREDPPGQVEAPIYFALGSGFSAAVLVNIERQVLAELSRTHQH